MKIALRPVLFVALSAAVLMLLGLSATASASHAWGTYHWPRAANPFTITLADNAATSWDGFLTKSSADWTLSSVLDTTIVPGSANPRRCRPSLGIVQVCNYAYGANGWLGLAQIWINGSHITKGSVKVNDTYFVMPKYKNKSEKRHVMCQEIGHTFGLDHQDTSGASLNTCMDYYKNQRASDTQSTRPNTHDYNQLVSIYSHFDLISPVSDPSAEFDNLDWNAQAEWGNLAQTSDNGQSSLYVRDLGNGNKVLTYVDWAK